ncbi:4'-phosphopantetheinyl transferase family protein [Methylobacterium phyllosphaerae]
MRPADRARFIASHAALRFILGEALDLAPAGLRFATGPAGKPDLAGVARGSVTFNLSHSGARALIGLAHKTSIGVDIEAVRSLPDALRIARAHFAADEVSALADTPGSAAERVFFGLWTRKEAVVKALGSGLSLPLDRFSVSVPPARPRLLRMPAGDPPLDGPWSLADVACGTDYAATVAVRSAEAAIAVRRLPDAWPDQLG